LNCGAVDTQSAQKPLAKLTTKGVPMRKHADPRTAGSPYADFIKRQVTVSARSETAPTSMRGWEERLIAVRQGLARSMGRLPERPCDLQPQVLGTLIRDGYAIERLTFQSWPGVRVPANLYRPEPARARYPGVLSVHGHWAWARMDQHVQPRCIALAKLGYVVLCVDAFGAGERAIEPGSGTYHGALTGASLWPAGCSLLGLQVYDNQRAVDYLSSRPEVDAASLAITGASGGGNQTLYAGAIDQRFSAVVPVCGIGTYDAYLSTACCVCEVNVGGALFASTGDLLAMIAPRALLVISATRDAHQFSVAEASRSVARARERFRLLGAEEKIRHVAIESGHDYNQPMREAMYGWMEKWLKGRGDGGPVPEPKLTVEDIALLRCYADGPARPKSIVTIPRFVRSVGEARLARAPKAPDHRERWYADSARMRAVLRDQAFGGFPPRPPLDRKCFATAEGRQVTITTEPGLRSRAVIGPKSSKSRGTALIVAPGALAERRPEGASDRDEAEKLKSDATAAGFVTFVVPQPRATGTDAPGAGPVADVIDHTPAEWALWVGRPLLGQWVWDIIRWLDLFDELAASSANAIPEYAIAGRPYLVVGIGAMSVPAILAAALDSRIAGVACTECLVSYVATDDKPWRRLPMGLLVPNILELADVAQLAALAAPRPLMISRCVEPGGESASSQRVRATFSYCEQVYRLLGAPENLKLLGKLDLESLIP
jgi:dienelactone hydrolase